MPLPTEIKKELNDNFSCMTKDELDEVLDMLLEEAFKRDWDDEPMVKEVS